MTILETDERSIRVSFPGKDYPIEGMGVELECHDDTGFTAYRTAVLERPGKDNAIRLKRPQRGIRNQHRDCFRVPTDLTAQVKDQVHMRKYDAAVLNLSTSGALLRTPAPFDFTTTVELTISLPGQPVHAILAQVMHVAESLDHRGDAEHFLGLRFIGKDSLASRSITQYIQERLRELHPAY